jgi:hypothetical protein
MLTLAAARVADVPSWDVLSCRKLLSNANERSDAWLRTWRSRSEEPHEIVADHHGRQAPGTHSVAILRAAIGASIEKDTHNLAVAIADVEERYQQGGVTEPVAGMHIRASPKEHPDSICMLLLSSEVQRREPRLVGKVYNGAVLQVCGHVGGLAFESGIVQRRTTDSVYFGSHAGSMHYPGYSGLAARVHNHTVTARCREAMRKDTPRAFPCWWLACRTAG